MFWKVYDCNPSIEKCLMSPGDIFDPKTKLLRVCSKSNQGNILFDRSTRKSGLPSPMFEIRRLGISTSLPVLLARSAIDS